MRSSRTWAASVRRAALPERRRLRSRVDGGSPSMVCRRAAVGHGVHVDPLYTAWVYLVQGGGSSCLPFISEKLRSSASASRSCRRRSGSRGIRDAPYPAGRAVSGRRTGLRAGGPASGAEFGELRLHTGRAVLDACLLRRGGAGSSTRCGDAAVTKRRHVVRASWAM